MPNYAFLWPHSLYLCTRNVQCFMPFAWESVSDLNLHKKTEATLCPTMHLHGFAHFVCAHDQLWGFWNCGKVLLSYPLVMIGTITYKKNDREFLSCKYHIMAMFTTPAKQSISEYVGLVKFYQAKCFRIVWYLFNYSTYRSSKNTPGWRSVMTLGYMI